MHLGQHLQNGLLVFEQNLGHVQACGHFRNRQGGFSQAGKKSSPESIRRIEARIVVGLEASFGDILFNGFIRHGLLDELVLSDIENSSKLQF